MRVGVAVVLVGLAVLALIVMMRSGGRRPVLQALTERQGELSRQLRRDVEALTARGPRTVFIPDNLQAAAAFVAASFKRAGYAVQRQPFRSQGATCENVEVEIRGLSRPDEILIIGAHYDSVDTSPGADDNASGVAALLAVSRRAREMKPARTVRFVAFANEEPPLFTTPEMGSYVYAKRSHERGETIVGMISLESIGYYDPAPRSQKYPPPLSALYPNTGDFIGFAGNLRSRKLIAESVAAFRRHSSFPAESAALPDIIQEAGWSDQWAFWQFGWPALMITDTALFRNPHYHLPSDLPGTLDYERLARVVEGLTGMVSDLAGR